MAEHWLGHDATDRSGRETKKGQKVPDLRYFQPAKPQP